MKSRKNFLLFLLMFFLSFSSLSAADNSLKGIELCNSVYNFLDKYHFSPISQNIVTSGENTFPYNIIINKKTDDKTNKNLVLVFFQEDTTSNKTTLIKILSYIKNSNFNFNITSIFVYGEKSTLQKDNNISSLQVYLNTINTNEDYYALIFDLQNENNKIITSSNGYTSPSWIIQNVYNSFLNHQIKAKLPYSYISQIYKLKIFQDSHLSSFYDKNIPAIKICFNNSNNNLKSVQSTIIDSIAKFENLENQVWDQHFLMLKLFGRFRKVSESFIINIIILIIFSFLLFIFILGFVNTRLRKHTWSTINYIWFSIPITFIIITVTYLLSSVLFKNLFFNLSDFGKVYSYFTLEILLSFSFVTLYYLFTLQNNIKFNEKTIEYLLVISTFINQFIFILVDISLFPIFMFICCLSIIALLIKNNIIHICLLILTIIPFVFYSHNVITNADTSMLSQYVFDNYYISLYFSLIMNPIYLIYFRILTSFKTHSKTKKNQIISTLSFSASIFIILISLSLIRINVFNKNNIDENNTSLKVNNNYLVNFDYSDKNVFSDVIRTINIKFESQPETCTVTLNTLSKSPILYTDNDYILQSPTCASFKIPVNPPSELKFSYGTTSDPCNITITAIYETDIENEYEYVSKSFTIGD